jgi:hypothetical protein
MHTYRRDVPSPPLYRPCGCQQYSPPPAPPQRRARQPGDRSHRQLRQLPRAAASQPRTSARTSAPTRPCATQSPSRPTSQSAAPPPSAKPIHNRSSESCWHSPMATPWPGLALHMHLHLHLRRSPLRHRPASQRSPCGPPPLAQEAAMTLTCSFKCPAAPPRPRAPVAAPLPPLAGCPCTTRGPTPPPPPTPTLPARQAGRSRARRCWVTPTPLLPWPRWMRAAWTTAALAGRASGRGRGSRGRGLGKTAEAAGTRASSLKQHVQPVTL